MGNGRKNPADLGYDGSKYILPKLNIVVEYVESPRKALIPMPVTVYRTREARKLR